MQLLKQVRHRRWRRHLSAYVDRRLEPPHQAALERHLALCLLCQEELAALRRVVALLRRVPQVEAPRSFALSQAPSPALRRPALHVSPIRYATAVAAILLLAVVVGDLAIGRSSGSSSAIPGVADTMTAPTTGAQQDLSQATPFVAVEKSLEPREAGASPAPALDKAGTLHNWFRWGEIALGVILSALVTVLTVQWRRGRRTMVR